MGVMPILMPTSPNVIEFAQLPPFKEVTFLTIREKVEAARIQQNQGFLPLHMVRHQGLEPGTP